MNVLSTITALIFFSFISWSIAIGVIDRLLLGPGAAEARCYTFREDMKYEDTFFLLDGIKILHCKLYGE